MPMLPQIHNATVIALSIQYGDYFYRAFCTCGQCFQIIAWPMRLLWLCFNIYLSYLVSLLLLSTKWWFYFILLFFSSRIHSNRSPLQDAMYFRMYLRLFLSIQAPVLHKWTNLPVTLIKDKRYYKSIVDLQITGGSWNLSLIAQLLYNSQSYYWPIEISCGQ